MEINTQETETESIIENKTEEQENALVKHARHELNLILEEAKTDGDEEDIRMQKIFNDGILKVVNAFADCDHSGFSASIAINYLNRLLRFKPLMPLTLEDDEWNEVGIQHNEDSQVKVYQNNRASNVFKEADKFDGKPYCIDGPNGEIVTLEEYPRVYFGDFRTAKEIEEQNKKEEEKSHATEA